MLYELRHSVPPQRFSLSGRSALPAAKSHRQRHAAQVPATIQLIHLKSQLLTHIFKTLHTNSRIAHTKYKMPHISCKMKHCIQNITNTSQKQTFANTFAIILIPVRCCVLHRELCVVFCKKCFMKLKTESKAKN